MDDRRITRSWPDLAMLSAPGGNRRSRRMHNLSIALIFVLSASVGVRAQLAVHDPAVTTRNTITAVVKELLLRVQQEQHRQVRRMAQRLSLFTDLRKYALPEPPRWRTHGGGLFSRSEERRVGKECRSRWSAAQ